LSFLLVLFATDRRTGPGGAALERQGRYYGVYQKEVLVGWAFVGNPQSQRTVEGKFHAVECQGSFTPLSPAGETTAYLTKSLYPSDSPDAVLVTGNTSNSVTHVWECRVSTQGIELEEGSASGRLGNRRLVVPKTSAPFVLHRYAIGDWERLYRRCQSANHNLRVASVEIFDIAKNALCQVRCVPLGMAFETVLDHKAPYAVVGFGSLAQGYFNPETNSLDKLVLLEEQVTFVREDARRLRNELPDWERF